MNINRHNYELFFLLYIDNELSVPERNALELFVQENADLQEELQMLKQTVVQPDKFTFKGKDRLLKPEIVAAELQEQLLLLIDNELDATQSKKLELLLAADESAGTELQLLQQTKLIANNNIVFADKKSLYRKEPARVVAFDPIAIGWRRLAVAAVFIGFAIWGTVIYFNSGNKVAIDETASNNGLKQPAVVKPAPATVLPVEKTPPAETIAAVTPEPVISKKVTQKAIEPSANKLQELPVIKKNNDLVAEQKIITNNLPKPYFEENNNTASNKNKPANVIPQTQNINPAIIASSGIDKKAPPEENNTIYAASFTDNKEMNEDRFVLSDSDDDEKKSKLSGFLRKAKRVIERTTSIKSGDNNLKVANIEIAIH
jgi:hypothetical protein